ncbi:hypothetical protein ACPOL_0761 [Acidisarcina polymorpha]|uniref:Uncharacterized protein n=1 Tax=Acidisarcina polymorpha TaxID=2211140 RepID=A0A2Z5FTU8_9BACT|nr:hypothetical protein ACPOL_0761 [Acidisarcina polymorpha]
MISCAFLLAATGAQRSLAAARADRLELGRVPAGAAVVFTRSSAGWGLTVGGSGGPELSQPEPARIQVSDGPGEIRELAAAYKTATRTGDALDASADLKDVQGVSFQVHDEWRLKGDVLSVQRTVSVHGTAPGGFDSAVLFDIQRSTTWDDVNYLAPGVLYADPTYDGVHSPGGTLNFAAHHLMVREDILPAPMFGMYFKDGASVTMLDPMPRGDTTEDESKLTQPEMTDSRFQFGSLGVWQQQSGVQFGFRYPASVDDFSRSHGDGPPQWVRRFHPIQAGFSQSYQVDFRLAHAPNFREFSRESWRWSWDTLRPAVNQIDVLMVRRVLMDHLAAQVTQIDGHTGVPFVLSTMNDVHNWNWTMVAMGFVGKDLDCADALLQEGDRDPGPRGQHMRKLGLAMISTMIQALPTVPLPATGIDLTTGQPWDHIWLSPWLRNATEDMRVLMLAYRREKKLGRDHPEWIAWVRQYADWLIQQQRPDGSFPRRWKPSSNEAVEPSGTASYNAVPVLVLMSEETGDPKYRQSALRAAEYTWTNYGSRGLFIGGASDNPNITDKEAGMLSLDAFLSLYEDDKDPKWLDRAKAAGDFAESWIWIWNLPMPADADNAQLHWKKGVPTVGLQGITALHAGGADEYLDCAVGLYARLYNYTRDPHYLEVTRVLLDDTKSMVALPGRLYDMKGPGWQQENFGLGPGPRGRGVGSHRLWLPWISANHLHGINSLEEYDPALFRSLTSGTHTQSSPSTGDQSQW